MKMYEYGAENKKTVLMFQCSGEMVMVQPDKFCKEAMRFLEVRQEDIS